MSDHVEGLVAKITGKKAGSGVVYNVCLEIEGQDDEWFGHGFDKPDFYEGDFIEFDIEWNGEYANFDTNSIHILEEGDGKPSKLTRKPAGRGGRSNSGGRSSGGRGGSSSSRSKPTAKSGGAAKTKGGSDDKMSKDEWAQKDQMIRRQACMNTSIKLVGLLIAEGAVPIPKKKADAYDAVVALCDEEAERLYDQYEEQVYGGGKKRGSGRSSNTYDDDIPE